VHTGARRGGTPSTRTTPQSTVRAIEQSAGACSYVQVLPSRLCALCTVFLHCLTAICVLLYVRGIWEGEDTIAAEGSAERVGTLLDDLMQGNGSLIMTPNSWPLRATAVERARGVNAKTLDPAAEQPHRRGKPEGRSDCTARMCDGRPGYEAAHRVPCQLHPAMTRVAPPRGTRDVHASPSGFPGSTHVCHDRSYSATIERLAGRK